jgi:mRNA interferase MazF
MRRKRPLQLGEVLLVDLPRHLPPGHEQEGSRPGVVVGLPERLGPPRYPVVVVVPVTTQSGPWAQPRSPLYLELPAGAGGLHQASVVLLEHLRGVDRRRVRGSLGTLTPDEYAPIQAGLRQMFDLPEGAAGTEGTAGEPAPAPGGAAEGAEGEAESKEVPAEGPDQV